MPKSQCREEMLDIAWAEARRIESIKEGDGRPEERGEIRKNDRIYRFYKSEDGKYWYAARICIGAQEMSEYEAIFGRRKKKV